MPSLNKETSRLTKLH